jgi:ABC-2 type transport system permease protein
MMTRAPRFSILVGLSSYPILWTIFRGVLMVFAGWLIGARVAWSGILPALALIGLIACIHWSIGLVGAAMILVFRTTGPLATVVVVLTTLLGGAYYPTSVIPSWIQQLAALVPASYGFRALRRVLLDGAPLTAVRSDALVLLFMAAGLLLLGWVSFRFALNHARRVGSLGHL